jgi:hypothetical protein
LVQARKERKEQESFSTATISRPEKQEKKSIKEERNEYYTKTMQQKRPLTTTTIQPEKKRKIPKKDYEVKPYIDDAKELWNQLMDKDKITKQKSILENAGVYVEYCKKGNDIEWHRIIEYKDPKLSKYAEKVLQYFQERGISCKHRTGSVVK